MSVEERRKKRLDEQGFDIWLKQVQNRPCIADLWITNVKQRRRFLGEKKEEKLCESIKDNESERRKSFVGE